MPLQIFRIFLAKNSESLLGFPTIRGGSNFSLRIDWERIVPLVVDALRTPNPRTMSSPVTGFCSVTFIKVTLSSRQAQAQTVRRTSIQHDASSVAKVKSAGAGGSATYAEA